MRILDWLFILALIALAAAMPGPATRRQQVAAVVCIVVLVIIGLVVFGVIR